jgi:hypothetical protein
MSCPKCGRVQQPHVVRLHGAVRAGMLALTVLLACWLTGDLLQDLAEGVQRSQLPWGKLWVPLLAVLATVIAIVERRPRWMCTHCGHGRPPGWAVAQPAPTAATGTTRRVALRVLGTGAATLATAGGAFAAVLGRHRAWLRVGRTFFGTPVEKTAPRPRPEWQGARVRNYRRLGRTNAMVSDISLGSGQINNVEVARLALDRGVTYFDTAPDYAETGSEQLLGEALQGRRDQVFLATKFCVADGHLPLETPVPKIIAAVEGSLRRLRTDRVDLVHIHSCDQLERLMAPNFHEAFDRLKEQGKARFMGVSSHSPNLEAIANAAIDSGRFDVIMLAYHFGMWPNFGHILEKAKQHDVGVVAMKTLKGAKHTNLDAFRDAASAYSQAAFRWVLSNPNVSCLVISFSQLQHCDEYLYASGAPPQPGDVALLERYDQLIAGDYCQPHCGQCLDSCPVALPINDILRYRMYAKDYGWAAEGVRHYAALERHAAACVTCPAPCTSTCPIGVPIRTKMLDAHRVLRAVA